MNLKNVDVQGVPLSGQIGFDGAMNVNKIVNSYLKDLDRQVVR